jgi:uncharacterized membrane protein
VEIVADRGIHAKASSAEWENICHKMEIAFKHAQFKEGVIEGIHAITQHLHKHFPTVRDNQNELSDTPVIL